MYVEALYNKLTIIRAYYRLLLPAEEANKPTATAPIKATPPTPIIPSRAKYSSQATLKFCACVHVGSILKTTNALSRQFK